METLSLMDMTQVMECVTSSYLVMLKLEMNLHV